jgi:NADH-quinone oxidoreductase subunit E
MSVRRLAEKQPQSFAFSEANRAWAEREIAKYPPGRQASAVISLLWRAQDQEGWVTEPAIRVIAEMLGMAKIRVLEIATFYTMFLLEPVGKVAHIQLCGTTPCWLRGADALKDVCRRRIGEQFHISSDGKFSWEEVECLGACVNAPLIQIGADTYEDLTADRLGAILDDLSAGRPVQAGPQIERQFSAPVGGVTSLTDAALYAHGSAPGPEVAVTGDSQATRPSAGADQREAADAKPPTAPNPGDNAAQPVSKV